MITQPPTRSQFERIEMPEGSSFSWKQISVPQFEAPFHHHPEVELTVITAGHGQRFVGDTVEPFQAGDVVLLGPHLPHAWFSAQNCRASAAVVIQFHPETLGGGLLKAPEMQPVRDLLMTARGGLVAEGGVARQVGEVLLRLDAESPVRRLMRLMEVLEGLTEGAANPGETRPLKARAPEETVSPVDRKRLDEVLRYIHANHHRPLALPEIAKVAALGPESFSRFFRRVTGHTFIETLVQIRLASALGRLAEGTETIAAVAYACGFEDLSNFNRQFRRAYGITPSEARRRAQRA